MGNTSQRRAIKNYRKRLSKRGMARFEVLGCDADRDLIRSLAKRLAQGGPDADRIRAAIGRSLAGEFRRAQHRRRPQRRHQRGITLAIDENERILAAFVGWRQSIDRNLGVAGIDKHRAGQIRDFARRIPA